MPTTAEQREHDESIRIRSAIEDLAIDVLSDSTKGLTDDPDEIEDELRDRLSMTFDSIQLASRVQARGRMVAEYEVVSRQARSRGYRSGALSFVSRPVASDLKEAGKWADDIAKLVGKRASDSDVRSAVARSKGKLSASARSIVEDAWADERERIATATAKAQKDADVLPFVGTVWDARMDRRTCPRCWDLNGTIRPLGIPFPGRQVPGKTHVGCRCFGGLIFAPVVASISDAA